MLKDFIFDGRASAYGDHRDIVENVASIRAALCRWDGVRFKCFNRTERDQTEAMLTVDERARVQFTWLEPIEKAHGTTY